MQCGRCSAQNDQFLKNIDRDGWLTGYARVCFLKARRADLRGKTIGIENYLQIVFQVPSFPQTHYKTALTFLDP